MWHEARKQERKIRGMLVDYRKRAERRQDFYEKIKADPTQFMQIHGRRCKIHLDPAVAAAGESPAIMMPWQGHHDNLIDRFDVRAHLDAIPVIAKVKEPEEPTAEERQCNYESYRILAQNDFLGITEEKYLHQLHLEEQYGINAQQMEMEKPKKKSGGVTIGYTYDDEPTGIAPDPIANTYYPPHTTASNSGGNNSQDESDSDIDVDVSIDISKIDTTQAHELNGCGRQYGMTSNDFYSFLTKDADEAESLRMAREEEQEKIMLCGRKSRRERRAQREKRFAGRTISPPSYAAKEEKSTAVDEKADSDSRSPTPENSGKITYITSFGGEDELTPHSKISINFFNKPTTLGGAIATNFSNMKTTGEHVTYADKVKQNLDKLKHLNDKRNQSKSPRKPLAYQRREYSKSRSRSRGRTSYSSRRHNYGGRTRYRDRLRSSRSSSSRSKHSRSRSRDRDRDRHRRRRTSSSSTSSSSSSSSYHRSKYRRSRNSNARRRRSTSSTSSTSSNDSRYRSTVERSRSRRDRNRRTRSRSRSRDDRSTTTQKTRSTSDNRSTSRSESRPVQAIAAQAAASPATIPATKLTDTTISTLCNSTSQASTLFKIIGHSVAMSVPPPPPPPPLPPQPVPMPVETLPPVEMTLSKEEPKLVEESVPIKKYYGRKRDDQSSSEESDDYAYDTNNVVPMDTTNSDATTSTGVAAKSTNLGKAASLHTKASHASASSSASSNINCSSSSSAKSSLNPRDRLKRKMQILLNKQYKADKLAEIEKNERQIQLQQEREDEMRELALRLRRRQRELRHKYGSRSPSKDSSDKSPSRLSRTPSKHSGDRTPTKNDDRRRSTSEYSERSRSRRDRDRRTRSRSRSRSQSRSRNRRSRPERSDRSHNSKRLVDY